MVFSASTLNAPVPVTGSRMWKRVDCPRATSVLCQIVAFVFAAGRLNRPPDPALTFHGALSAVVTELLSVVCPHQYLWLALLAVISTLLAVTFTPSPIVVATVLWTS